MYIENQDHRLIRRHGSNHAGGLQIEVFFYSPDLPERPIVLPPHNSYAT